jgi:hypothetical protein
MRESTVVNNTPANSYLVNSSPVNFKGSAGEPKKNWRRTKGINWAGCFLSHIDHLPIVLLTHCLAYAQWSRQNSARNLVTDDVILSRVDEYRKVEKFESSDF